MTGFSKLIGEGKLRAVYGLGGAVKLFLDDGGESVIATFINESAFRMILGHDVADFNRKMLKNSQLARRHELARLGPEEA